MSLDLVIQFVIAYVLMCIPVIALVVFAVATLITSITVAFLRMTQH